MTQFEHEDSAPLLCYFALPFLLLILEFQSRCNFEWHCSFFFFGTCTGYPRLLGWSHQCSWVGQLHTGHSVCSFWSTEPISVAGRVHRNLSLLAEPHPVLTKVSEALEKLILVANPCGFFDQVCIIVICADSRLFSAAGLCGGQLQTIREIVKLWLSFALRKKGSKTKKRMQEEEIEKGNCGPPTPKVWNFACCVYVLSKFIHLFTCLFDLHCPVASRRL